MEQDKSPRLRTFVAIARLEETAEAFADLAFALEQIELTAEEKLLRDYYARLSMGLRDSLEELRGLVLKQWRSETAASGD